MSAVDVKIGADWYYDLSDWSVTGDEMGLIPGDMTGGAGTMSFTVPETANARLLHGQPAILKDGDSGTTSGNLRLGGGNGANTTITGFSQIAKLNVTRTAEAYSGTLRGYIIYLLGLCGVTTNIAVSTQLAPRPVKYIGWEGNALDRMKDLCAAQQMTISLIGETFAFRTASETTLLSERSISDYSWEASEGQLAQRIEVAWYDTNAPAAQLVYPPGGWHKDVPVFQVDAGETAIYEIDLNPDGVNDGAYGMSATSIVQPVPADSVAREYVGPLSVYSVSGKDNLIVPAAQWTANGGSISLELLEGGSKIKVTITGSRETEYAPYQISMPADSDDYSSLRIYGAGMLYRRNVLKMQTGLNADTAPQETAPIVDMPFLNTYEAAWHAAEALLSKHSSAFYTITGTIGTIETVYPNPALFFEGTSLEQDPAKHPFGNLEGCVFAVDGLVFRIRSVTHTPSGITFKADQWAQSDFSGLVQLLSPTALPYGATVDQFNAYYPAGITADQLSANPMRGADL